MNQEILFQGLRNIAINHFQVTTVSESSEEMSAYPATSYHPSFRMTVQIQPEGSAELSQEGGCTSPDFCTLLFQWRTLVDAYNMSLGSRV
jgi:hypothetical protein